MCPFKSTRLLPILFVLLLFPPRGKATDPPVVWTVQKAVRYALEHNPDARIVRHRIQAAGAAVRQAQAAFYPRLSLSGGYSRTDNPMYSFGNILNQQVFSPAIDFNDPGVSDDLNLTASLHYNLYSGGGDRAALDVNLAREQAARWQEQSVRASLSFAVVQTFFTILQASETVEARLSAIRAIEASLEAARARYEAGDLLKADLLNLEVQLARARENRIQASHSLELAKRGLLNILGLRQGMISIDTGAGCCQIVPSESDFSRRPELARAKSSIQAAERELDRALASRYPRADLFGSWQVDKGFEYEHGSSDSWLAGIRIDYTLFDGDRTQAAIAAARAELARAREEYRKLELALGLEVEKARLGLAQAEERLQVTAKMVEVAEESARLSRERFRQGVILSSELIDVENRLTDALLRQTMARAARRIAVADLRRSLGLPQFPEETFPPSPQTESQP